MNGRISQSHELSIKWIARDRKPIRITLRMKQVGRQAAQMVISGNRALDCWLSFYARWKSFASAATVCAADPAWFLL